MKYLPTFTVTKLDLKLNTKHPVNVASLCYSTSSDLSKLLLVAKVTRLLSIVLHVHAGQPQPQKDVMD